MDELKHEHQTTTNELEMSMKTLILTATLIGTILAGALSAQANRYIDPNAPFNGQTLFESLPSGQ
jgi:hypothetical protein